MHKFAYAQNSRCVLVCSAEQEAGLRAQLYPLRTAQRNGLAQAACFVVTDSSGQKFGVNIESLRGIGQRAKFNQPG
jgi:uncharacterized radical SAM superfamily Fe-S cluster-containing enzyme